MELGLENGSGGEILLAITCDCGAVSRHEIEGLIPHQVITCACGKKAKLDDLSGIRAVLDLQASAQESFGKVFKGGQH